VLIFTDEASFRQDTTLHATWNRVGRAPEFWVTGERIELWRTVHYRRGSVFAAGSMPIAIGWKYTNCRLLPIKPDAKAVAILRRTEPTIATSPESGTCQYSDASFQRDAVYRTDSFLLTPLFELYDLYLCASVY
jgi:hypothetical protein